MNAPTAFSTNDLFGPASEAVNAWRGRCLAGFARVELAVSEALVALGGGDRKTALPLLVGHRFATLVARLETRGDAVDALTAVRAFGAHDPLRAFLCHGDAQIAVDRRGRWQATFTMMTPSQGISERRFLLVDADEATATAAKLLRDGQRLVDQLRRAVPGMSDGDLDKKEHRLRIGASPV